MNYGMHIAELQTEVNRCRKSRAKRVTMARRAEAVAQHIANLRNWLQRHRMTLETEILAFGDERLSDHPRLVA